jgi:CrcB protein
LAAVFLGGALGTVSRFLLDTAHPDPGGHFPTTTLIVNLSGSLAIGLLAPLMARLTSRLALLRPFLVVGVLGGWTTYSTLAVDGDLLFKGSHIGIGVGYLAATVFGGIALVLLGETLSRRTDRST